MDISHWGKGVQTGQEGALEEIETPEEIINDNDIKGLGEKLQSLKSLRELALYINDVKGPSMEMLVESVRILSRLRQLRTLIISLEGYDDLTGREAIEIGKAFYKYKTLETVMLSLRNCKIGNRELRELYKVLKPLESRMSFEIRPEIVLPKRGSNDGRNKVKEFCFEKV